MVKHIIACPAAACQSRSLSLLDQPDDVIGQAQFLANVGQLGLELVFLLGIEGQLGQLARPVFLNVTEQDYFRHSVHLLYA